MNEDKNFIKCIKRLFPDVPSSFFKLGDDGEYPAPIQDHWIVWQESNKNAVADNVVLFPKKPTKELYTAFHEAFSAAGTGRTVDNFRAGYGAMVALIHGNEGQ